MCYGWRDIEGGSVWSTVAVVTGSPHFYRTIMCVAVVYSAHILSWYLKCANSKLYSTLSAAVRWLQTGDVATRS